MVKTPEMDIRGQSVSSLHPQQFVEWSHQTDILREIKARPKNAGIH